MNSRSVPEKVSAPPAPVSSCPRTHVHLDNGLGGLRAINQASFALRMACCASSFRGGAPFARS
jgi:hypothetical protein